MNARRARAASGLASVLTLLLAAAAPACQAASTRFCDRPAALSAEQQDLLLRFGARIKQTLDDSGQRVALLSRSGLDLQRLGLRYSHAGVSLKASPNTPWSVRQLYYACDEGQPRLFDQGISGFVQGTDDPDSAYVSVLLLPAGPAAQLEDAALDRPRALALLHPLYSANAYAWSLQYQNCNQWLAELLASAWDSPADPGTAPRERAQRWLHERGYQPTAIDVGGPLMWLGTLSPWLHSGDHPRADVEAGVYRVSMPAAIEAFVRNTLPGAQRIEFCRQGRRMVIHPGWDAVADGCRPGSGDTVEMLE